MGISALTDELYEADPTEFVATRDRLAKELRADGRRDEASALKARRRPSVAAWALNQVARHHPAAISDLLDAFERARTAQDEALAGKGHDALRAALADRRSALRTVTRHAAQVVEASGRPPDATVRDVETALQRTLADEFVEALRAGELSDLDVAPADDEEEELGDLLSASVGLRQPVEEPEPAKPSRPSQPLQPSKRELERRRKLEALVAEREAEVRDARAELDTAQAAVGQAERALEKAERALEKANAELADVPDHGG
jgi:DNA repair exonuclease SbcCD ATPase subunit